MTSRRDCGCDDVTAPHPGPTRLVRKSGHINVTHEHPTTRYWSRFIADLFTATVDLRWSGHLLLFAALFLGSWLFFALLYYVIIVTYDATALGEVDPERMFASAFLFSLETQVTIGYGTRHTSATCPPVIAVVVAQSVYGSVMDAYVIGALLSKLSRGKRRARTILFSERAVIDRDDKLTFRVGDLLRTSRVLDVTVRAFHVSAHVTKEGEYLPLVVSDVELERDELFLTTPQLVTHVVDADSPLWGCWSPATHVWSGEFEIVVVLEGVVEATGMTTQARTSYLPDEILPGRRFVNVVKLDEGGKRWEVCLDRFHVTEQFQDLPPDQLEQGSPHLKSSASSLEESAEDEVELKGELPHPNYNYTVYRKTI